MSPEEIDEWYDRIKSEHEMFLSKYGVKLPARNSAEALWLVFLRKHLGKAVHKDTISSFVHTVRVDFGKDQQVRHLAEKGWYVLNKGEKIPNSEDLVVSGYHVLFSMESPKPTFIFKSLKRAGRIGARNFEELKAVYDFRCATCGSKENCPNFLEPDKKTTLQRGHMNPHKSLTSENTIPQCQVCNGIYLDDYVFDEKGRVKAVASVRPVLRSEREVQEEIKKKLQELSG